MNKFDKINSLLTPEEIRLKNEILKAGDVLMSYWPGSSEKNLNAEIKSDGTIVTEADYQANEILVKAVSEIFPCDCICSEESPIPLTEGKNPDRIWFIDPLDGTKFFAAGTDQFSIMVGLTIKGSPVFGFSFFPARNLLCFGAKGRGAWYNNEKLAVCSQTKDFPERIHLRNFTPPPAPGFNTTLESGTAQINVASNKFDICIIKKSTFKSYDFVAPASILLESGAVVCDQNGAEIKFLERDIPCEYYVCCAPGLKEKALSLIPEA